jgi:hypothetical protein
LPARSRVFVAQGEPLVHGFAMPGFPRLLVGAKFRGLIEVGVAERIERSRVDPLTGPHRPGEAARGDGRPGYRSLIGAAAIRRLGR